MRFIPLNTLRDLRYRVLLDFLVAMVVFEKVKKIEKIFIENGKCRVRSEPASAEAEYYPPEMTFSPSGNHKDCMIWTGRMNITPPDSFNEHQYECFWPAGPKARDSEETVARCLAVVAWKFGSKIPVTAFPANETPMDMVIAISQTDEKDIEPEKTPPLAKKKTVMKAEPTIAVKKPKRTFDDLV